MRKDAKRKMVVSMKPSGTVLITADGVESLGLSDEQICQMSRCCADSPATEIVAQTDQAAQDFCRRNGGKLLHGTLANYPEARN